MASGGNLDIRVTTARSNYDIRDVIYDGRPARVLYTSRSHTAQSGLARDDRPEQLFDYMERFMELVRGLRPRRILLIGGGAFVLPRAITAEFPATALTVAEIDDELPAVATRYFDFTPGPQTILHAGDGLAFLTATNEHYDLILLDVFDEDVIPAGFQSARAAALFRDHLSPQGTLAMNIIATLHGPRSAVLRRQIEALKSAFSYLQLFPAGHEESAWLPQNFILTAGNISADLAPYVRYTAKPLPASG